MNLGCACAVGHRWPGYGYVSTVSVTVLVDNTPGAGCLCAHGFAAWIQADGVRILYDTGPDPALLRDNARSLGLELADLDAVVLSHGHADHTGGLPAVLEAVHRPVPVFLHPAARDRRFSHNHAAPVEIGLPAAVLASLERGPGRIQAVIAPTQVMPGVWASGPIPRISGEDVGGRFAWDAEGLIPDSIPDDQALVVETSTGAVVLTGCCHSGVINTLDHLRGLGEGRQVRTLIGGLHLHSASTERIARTSAYLHAQVRVPVAVGHCTGAAAVTALGATPIACGWRWRSEG